MNILSIVKAKQLRIQRLAEAQQAHLQARAYRGVACPAPPKEEVRIIDGKRYSCLPLE